ncbi:24891_t:CDS:2, partial [Dentiscutata erythropus]
MTNVAAKLKIVGFMTFSDITHSVSHVAFGNYLSFSSGLSLSFFSKPSTDDASVFAKIQKILISRTVDIQLSALFVLMTYMTIRFFELNNENLPELLRKCSIAMYVFCGLLIFNAFLATFRKKKIKIIEFFGYIWGPSLIAIYIIQMIFQVYLKNNFPSTGYMFIFQWISLLSILLVFPLTLTLKFTSLGKMIEDKDSYALIFSIALQLYLHVGYISFFLYCDEGYLSSGLLFLGSFALGNMIRNEKNYIFISWKWDKVDEKPTIATEDGLEDNSFDIEDEINILHIIDTKSKI